MRNIDLIHEVTHAAAGRWPSVLASLNIDVPDSPLKHTACPACGGIDRFRFDDNGRGAHICNQCGAGDGLDLIQKVNQCSATDAAKLVADVLRIDYRVAKPDEAVASQRREQLDADHQQRKQERQQQAAAEAIQRWKIFTAKYQALDKKATPGESEYLAAKGLEDFTFPVLSNGSLLLPLVDRSGTVTAAQTITPQGEKRLLAGSAKYGAFYAVNAPDTPQSIVIGEGLATILSVHKMRPDALAVAAIDAGNLLPVAQVMRQKYPQAQIIIAADNDHPAGDSETGGTNIGKNAAEKTAKAVAGWVSIPPVNYKSDWNDYHKQFGLEVATQSFTESMYQPQGEAVKPQLQAIEGGKKRRSSEDLDLSQMAASQRGKVLAEYHGDIAVNPESGTAYVFMGSVWGKVADSELRRTMGAIFDQRDTPYSPKGIDSAIDAMKLQIPVIGKQRRELIGFENGTYDLTSGQFSAHRADNWLLNHNGITFTPPYPGENLKDHAPHYYHWLTHSAGNDQRKANRINAALFMILANRYDWQLFIEITGEGGSGKSVFSSIATILAGEHNTASGNMAALDSARGRAQYVGKSLITLPDQTRYVGEGAGIKAITGGDLVEIDGKYEKQFSTIIQAVVLATNNEPMAFTERNGGIARRRVIFPFNIPVADSEKDPDLMAKIRCEMPVVIRCLLSEFADQNRAKALLTEQRDSAEAMGVKRHSDPLYGFCEHIVALGEAIGMMMGNLNISPRAPRIYLYHAYLAYMDAHGFDKHLTLTRFGSDFPKVMKEYGVEYKKAKTNAGMRYNMELAGSADDWLPALPRQPEDIK